MIGIKWLSIKRLSIKWLSVKIGKWPVRNVCECMLTGNWRTFFFLKKNKRKINTHVLPPPLQNPWEAFFTRLVNSKRLSHPVLMTIFLSTPKKGYSVWLGRAARLLGGRQKRQIVCQYSSKAFHLERLRHPTRFEGRGTSPHPSPTSSRHSPSPQIP